MYYVSYKRGTRQAAQERICMSNTPRGLPLTSSPVQDIFPKLTPAQISRVSAHGHMRALHAGEVLYEQGDIAVPFFLVVSGELEILDEVEDLLSVTA